MRFTIINININITSSSMLLLLVLLFSVAWNEIAPGNDKNNKNNGLLVSAFHNVPIGAHHRATFISLPRKWTLSLLDKDGSFEEISQQAFEEKENSSATVTAVPNYDYVYYSRADDIEQELIPRSIRVERMPRLPVWPVWAGVIDFLVGWIFGAEAGSKLEQYVLGGRVCPMQLDGKSTSPFLLLVHHHHNFWKWDAIFRKISSLVLPEGFPAHPHRGFTTLTYFLEDDTPKTGGGGFVHRDSIGVKQTYGAKGSYKHQAQWLFTGKGMLHEEMFDFLQNDFGNDNPKYNPRYELYQLWVNVPGKHKLDSPRVQLLRETEGDGKEDNMDTMPRVIFDKILVSEDGKQLTTHSEVVVIAGSYQPCEDSKAKCYQSQAEPLHSDLSILHVTVEETENKTPKALTSSGKTPPEQGWIYDIPSDHDTLIVYVRKGSCDMITTTASVGDDTSVQSSQTAEVPIHSTVFVERKSTSFFENKVKEQLKILPKELDNPLDLLVLSGKSLYQNDNANYGVEPVAMQGSMVMNNNAQIQQAYTDYQYGKMGVPWDHELGDGEWMEHVRQTKPRTPTEIESMQEYEK